MAFPSGLSHEINSLLDSVPIFLETNVAVTISISPSKFSSTSNSEPISIMLLSILESISEFNKKSISFILLFIFPTSSANKWCIFPSASYSQWLE